MASWGPSQASLGSKRKVGKCTQAVCCRSSPWAHCLSHSTLWLPNQQIFSSVGLGRRIPSREFTSVLYLCNKSEFPTETLCVSPWTFPQVHLPSVEPTCQRHSECQRDVPGIVLMVLQQSVLLLPPRHTCEQQRERYHSCIVHQAKDMAWHCCLHSCFT